MIKNRNKCYMGYYESPLGPMTMACDGEYLVGLWFDGQITIDKKSAIDKEVTFDKENAIDDEDNIGYDYKRNTYCKSQDHIGIEDDDIDYHLDSNSEKVHAIFKMTRRWLDLYFAGKVPDFTPPLKPSGSDFRKIVAEIMFTIPYGELMTYGEIAKIVAQRLGKKRMSAQAVGGAVGHNTISLIIPCHRVVGSNGSLTGYAGGMQTKVWLLQHEGVDFEKEGLFIPTKRTAFHSRD